MQQTGSVVLLNKKYIYCYLRCIVYEKLLKPRQSFRILAAGRVGVWASGLYVPQLPALKLVSKPILPGQSRTLWLPRLLKEWYLHLRNSSKDGSTDELKLLARSVRSPIAPRAKVSCHVDNFALSFLLFRPRNGNVLRKSSCCYSSNAPWPSFWLQKALVQSKFTDVCKLFAV